MNSIPPRASLRFVLPPLAMCAALVVIAGLPPEQQPPIPPELEKMHMEHLRHFSTAPGFGESRIDRIPSQLEVTLACATYKVVRPDLIGLENKVVAYLNPGVEVVSKATLTTRESRTRLRTRPIRADESRAIAELRKGKDIVQQAAKIQVHQGATRTAVEVPVVRVVGALRATATCARCHQVPEGTLLGAFSYTLQPAKSVAVSSFASAGD